MEGVRNFTIKQTQNEISKRNLKRSISQTGIQTQLTQRYCKKYGSSKYFWFQNNETGDWQLWDVYHQRLCFNIPSEGPNVIITPNGKCREYIPRVAMKKLPILPDGIIQHIFTFLEPEDLLNCQLVCKKWKKVSSLTTLWMHVPKYTGLEDITNLRIRYIQAIFRNMDNFNNWAKLNAYFIKRPAVKDCIYSGKKKDFEHRLLRAYIRKNEQLYRDNRNRK